MRFRPLLLLPWLALVVAGCPLGPAELVQCRADRDCTGFHAVCGAAGICTTAADAGMVGPAVCHGSAECQDAAKPLCVATECKACVPTVDNASCLAKSPTTPRCDATGACAGCLMPQTEAAECQAAAPICSSDGSCRKCTAHTECKSKVCKLDGTCAAAADIAYVDNGGAPIGTCRSVRGLPDGSAARPFCDIYDALALPKRFVVVSGHLGAPYSAIQIGDMTVSRDVTIIGPGKGDAQPVTIYDPLKVAVSLHMTTMPAQLTLDGLEIGDRMMPSSNAGVDCQNIGSGAVALTIRRSAVQLCGGVGVNVSSCALTLDQDAIGRNTGGGVQVSGAAFTITNNLIFDNGSGNVPGVYINAGTMADTFAFNTVARNHLLNTGVGGVDCGNGGFALANSIIWQNDTLPHNNGTQLGSNCLLMNVVTGIDTNASGIKIDPVFVKIGSDYRLVPTDPANAQCCIDQIPTATQVNSDHDAFGTPRPQNVKWDIGAHEVK